MNTTKLDEAINHAIKRLSGSERGRQALKDFKALMDNGGISLDSENSNAVCLLSLAALKEGRREFLLDIESTLSGVVS